MVGLLYLIVVFLPAQNQDHIEQASTQLAVERGRLIAHQLNRWQAQLDAIADLEALLNAFDERDQAQVTRLERQYRRAFPEAVSLRLIPLGQLGIAGLRGEEVQLRNNIEMDMLRTVNNVTGDAMVATVVAATEDELGAPVGMEAEAAAPGQLDVEEALHRAPSDAL